MGLAEQWRLGTGRDDSFAYYPPPLVILEDRVIAGCVSNAGKPASGIKAISLTTGKVLWESLFGKSISSSFHDSRRFYVFSVNELSAFSIQDGKQVWEKELPDHHGYWFLPWDPPNPLRIYSDDHKLFLLDPETGNILSTEVVSTYMNYSDGFVFIYTYHGVGQRFINFVNLNANKVVWEREIDRLSKWQPTIVNDKLLYLRGSIHSPIACVLISSGEDCWKTTERYISNYAIANELLYAVNESGALVALDINTGQEVGRLTFTGLPPQDPGGYPFWVAADEEYVLVYFGDSQELIAFKGE
jgi:outer membrane protein assembly factor BamB